MEIITFLLIFILTFMFLKSTISVTINVKWLKFSVCVLKVLIERAVSRCFFITDLVFILPQKSGNFLYQFLHLIELKLRPKSKRGPGCTKNESKGFVRLSQFCIFLKSYCKDLHQTWHCVR